MREVEVKTLNMKLLFGPDHSETMIGENIQEPLRPFPSSDAKEVMLKNNSFRALRRTE
jgi:hypothetical protein